MKQALKDRWSKLDPKVKQRAVIGGIVAAFVLLGVASYNTDGGSARSRAQTKIANELLPKEASRDLGVSGVASDVARLQEESRKKDDQITKLQSQLAKLGSQGQGGSLAASTATNRELQTLREEIRKLRDDKSRGATGPAGPSTSTSTSTGAAPRPGSQTMGPPTPRGGSAEPTGGGTFPAASPASAPASTGGIRTITEGSGVAAAAAGGKAAAIPASKMLDKDGREKVPTTHIPRGAIMTGAIITGLDAPTGKGAMRDPIPVLVRIKHEAILPNRYRADVKECFLLASGHGDLASERAYLRAVGISCIRNDRKIIDIDVEMYAVGTDGKAGVRGRLVSKQGQVIAKAALAGIAQGFSQALTSNRYNSYGNQSGGVDYDYAMQNGTAYGAGSAFDRIAKYYLDLADQIFPVIEIDAGQKISFVMVKGASMGVLRDP